MTPFSLAFGGVGVGAFIAMVAVLLGKGSGTTSPQEAREAVRAAGASTDGGAKSAGFLWVFAFFWNAMAWPIALLAIPQIIAEGQWVGLFVILFPLVGLGLLWGAVAASWNAWKSRRGAKSPGAATATGSLTTARSLPGSMAAKAAKAMFDPPDGAVRGGFGRTPVREIPIPPSLATVEEGGGAMTLRYSPRRWLGIAIVVSVVGGIVTLIGAVMMAKEGFGFAPLITILVGSAIDVAAVAMLTSRLEVTVRQGRLEVRKRGLFGRRQWDLSRGEVTALRPSISHRINNYPYFTLNAVTAVGEQVPIGSSIRGPELTDSLARRIARAFGLPTAQAVPAGTVTE